MQNLYGIQKMKMMSKTFLSQFASALAVAIKNKIDDVFLRIQ